MLEARGLVKLFGRVVGLDDVDLTLYSGEILAVIGDNGAGKSTLIKCLSGALIPDQGSILLDGKEVRFRAPQDARDAGIETVYQQPRRRPGPRHRQQPVPGQGDPRARGSSARCSACSTPAR